VDFELFYRRHRIPPFRTEREKDGAPLVREVPTETKARGSATGLRQEQIPPVGRNDKAKDN